MARDSGHRPGGGIASRQRVSVPVRTGSGSRSANPAGVSQLGNKQGSHVTRGEESKYRGDPLHSGRSFQPVPFGNQVALNVGAGGPGTGRDVHKTGSQGMQGTTNTGNPRPQGRDILSSFGPESKPRSNPGRSDIDADE
jgi:hypothetical protein